MVMLHLCILVIGLVVVVTIYNSISYYIKFKIENSKEIALALEKEYHDTVNKLKSIRWEQNGVVVRDKMTDKYKGIVEAINDADKFYKEYKIECSASSTYNKTNYIVKNLKLAIKVLDDAMLKYDTFTRRHRNLIDLIDE